MIDNRWQIQNLFYVQLYYQNNLCLVVLAASSVILAAISVILAARSVILAASSVVLIASQCLGSHQIKFQLNWFTGLEVTMLG